MDFAVTNYHKISNTEQTVTVRDKIVPLRLVEVLEITEDIAGRDLYTFVYKGEVMHSYLTKH
jgi:hypothetical protein